MPTRAIAGGAHRSARRAVRSADVAAIRDALGALDRAMRVESPRAARLVGVSGAQWRALRAIAEGPASSMSEVARRTHTDISSVSVVVKRLAGRGFVTRTPGDTDRRRVTLDLTPRGRAAVGRAPGSKGTRIGRATTALSPRARGVLGANLVKLALGFRLAAEGKDSAPR